jgi:hypothetical protein
MSSTRPSSDCYYQSSLTLNKGYRDHLHMFRDPATGLYEQKYLKIGELDLIVNVQ